MGAVGPGAIGHIPIGEVRDRPASRRRMTLHVQAVVLELAIQRFPVESEQLGRARLVAARLPQHLENIETLDIAHWQGSIPRLADGRVRATSPAGPPRHSFPPD